MRGLLPPKGSRWPSSRSRATLPTTLYIFWPKMVAPPRDLNNLLRGPREPGVLDDFLPSFFPVLCSSELLGLPSPLPSQAILLQYSDAQASCSSREECRNQ